LSRIKIRSQSSFGKAFFEMGSNKKEIDDLLIKSGMRRSMP
jgi:hypothetical protein